MFRRPSSHALADRRARGSLTVPVAIVVVAFAGLTVGACTAPAAAISLEATAGPVLIGEHSALGPRQVEAANEALASVPYPRGEHAAVPQGSVATTVPTFAGESSDSLRTEHLPNAADIISSSTSDSQNSLRQEHLHGVSGNGS